MRMRGNWTPSLAPTGHDQTVYIVLSDFGPLGREHYGQRSHEPRQKAGHMAAPTNAANVKKVLANPESSTQDPKRK